MGEMVKLLAIREMYRFSLRRMNKNKIKIKKNCKETWWNGEERYKLTIFQYTCVMYVCRGSYERTIKKRSQNVR